MNMDWGKRIGSGANERGLGLSNMGWGKRIGAETDE